MDDKTSAIDPVGRPSDPARTRASGEAAPEAGHANEARRKLIDELIQTGVPAVAAAQAGTHGGRWLASLYIVIPLLAVSLLFGLRETTGSKENASADGGRPVTGTSGGPNEELAVGAENISFDTDTLTLKTGTQTVIHFENRDGPSVQHNVAIYENSDAQDPIFQGDIIPGDTDADYEFTAPPSGEYFFRCDIHPSMNGTVVVES